MKQKLNRKQIIIIFKILFFIILTISVIKFFKSNSTLNPFNNKKLNTDSSAKPSDSDDTPFQQDDKKSKVRQYDFSSDDIDNTVLHNNLPKYEFESDKKSKLYISSTFNPDCDFSSLDSSGLKSENNTNFNLQSNPYILPKTSNTQSLTDHLGSSTTIEGMLKDEYLKHFYYNFNDFTWIEYLNI